jgi:hypothetical protein
LAEVVTATVYEAVLILVRTATPEAIPAVDADLVMPARKSTGTFLFNHFASPDAEGALRVWEEVAGSFTDKAGVEDSVLPGPLGESPFVFVNHVRLPSGPFRFFLRLTKPSFRRTVSRQLRTNRIDFAAVVCRPVLVR